MFVVIEPIIVEPEERTRITFMDGSPSVEIRAARSSTSSTAVDHWSAEFVGAARTLPPDHAIVPARKPRHDLFYAWWHGSEAEIAEDEEMLASYHSKVKLPQGEALLVDTGAIKPLAGDAWVRRVATTAELHGRGTTFVPLEHPMHVEGVGQGSSSCTHRAVLPIAMEDGITGSYSPAVVPNSEIPALLGYDTLEGRRVLLDTYNGKYIEVGPGGYDLQLSPGSRLLHLRKAATGHPMLPITDWDKVKPGTAQAYSNLPPSVDL